MNHKEYLKGLIDKTLKEVTGCCFAEKDDRCDTCNLLLEHIKALCVMSKLIDEHESAPLPELATWGRPQLVMQYKNWYQKEHAIAQAALDGWRKEDE